MKKLIVMLIISLASVSCCQNTRLSGTYNTDDFFQTLVLMDDSTFIYNYRLSSFPMSVTKGKWEKIDNNMIILNSVADYLPINVYEKYSELDSIVFKIKEPDSLSIKMVEYKLLLDNILVLKQQNPIIKIPKSKGKFKSIAVNVIFIIDSLPVVNNIRYDVTTEAYQRIKKSSNYFEIQIPFDDYMHYGENMENDKILIEGKNRLYWKRKGELYFKKAKR